MNRNFLASAIITLVSSVYVQAAPRCDQVFVQPKAVEARFMQGLTLDKRDFNTRVEEFAAKYPRKVKLLKNATIKGDDGWAGQKDLLIISTKTELTEAFKQDYFNLLSYRTISFPMSSSGGHLYTRIGNKSIDNYHGATERDYYFSNERLETFLHLTEAEYNNVGTYIKNTVSSTSKTIGNNTEYDGVKSTNRSTIFKNGNNHNCTSWLATAPVGEQGQSFKEVIGARADYDIGTNPGWWTMYINTRANKAKAPLTVLFVEETVGQATKNLKKTDGSYELEWDFGTH